MPIYPIVIFSYDAPQRAEPKQHVVSFPGFVVNRFTYRVIQLNRLSWRRFVHQLNPVAVALMAKMKIADQDRPKVKLQCLRLLLTLRLNPAKSELIFLFFDSYLKLTGEEERRYQQAVAKLPQTERKETMELLSSWRLEGRQEGKEELVSQLINRKFGTVSSELQARVHGLSSEQMDELGLALFDLQTFRDVEHWFDSLK